MPRQVGVAADRLAAVAVVGQQLGLVADADLPHLDPGLERAGQVLDQLAEVDPLLGQVVEDHPLAAEDDLDVDQVHLEPSLGDELAAGGEGRAWRASASRASAARSSADAARRISPRTGFSRNRAVRSVAGQSTSPSSVPRSLRTTTRWPRGCSWPATPVYSPRSRIWP